MSELDKVEEMRSLLNHKFNCIDTEEERLVYLEMINKLHTDLVKLDINTRYRPILFSEFLLYGIQELECQGITYAVISLTPTGVAIRQSHPILPADTMGKLYRQTFKQLADRGFTFTPSKGRLSFDPELILSCRVRKPIMATEEQTSTSNGIDPKP